jgi:hypothetical protein
MSFDKLRELVPHSMVQQRPLPFARIDELELFLSAPVQQICEPVKGSLVLIIIDAFKLLLNQTKV